MAEHVGTYYVPKGDPDDFGETIKFVHTKYPGYRVVIESRFPYRDAQGFARGVQNPATALTIKFQGRMLETNSARVIETLRSGQVPGYIGQLGPDRINEIIASGRRGGFFEVDKVEEEILLRRQELEETARTEIQARVQAEMAEKTEPKVEVFTEEDMPQEEDHVHVYADEPAPERMTATETVAAAPEVAGQRPVLECPGCGTLCQSRFCPECGNSLVPRQKRVWTCEDCGGQFDSGFKLGQHRQACDAVAKTIVAPSESKPMMGAAGTDSIQPTGDRFKGLL
jgi:rubrerythrin